MFHNSIRYSQTHHGYWKIYALDESWYTGYTNKWVQSLWTISFYSSYDCSGTDLCLVYNNDEKAWASNYYQNNSIYDASKANDNNIGTRWVTEITPNLPNPWWATKIYNIVNSVQISTYSSPTHAKKYALQYTDDVINWYTKGVFYTSPAISTTLSFTPSINGNDPYWSNVTFLLINAIYDLSNKHSQITNTNVEISTIPSPSSNYSLKFNHDLYSYLSIPYKNVIFNIYKTYITFEALIFVTSGSNHSTKSGEYSMAIMNNVNVSISYVTFNILMVGTSETSDMTLNFTYIKPDNTFETLVSTSSIQQNTWVHIAVSINSITPATSTITLYVNGIGTTFTSKNLTKYSINDTSIMKIGLSSWPDYYENSFDGYIGFIRITKDVIRYPSNFSVPITNILN